MGRRPAVGRAAVIAVVLLLASTACTTTATRGERRVVFEQAGAQPSPGPTTPDAAVAAGSSAGPASPQGQSGPSGSAAAPTASVTTLLPASGGGAAPGAPAAAPSGSGPIKLGIWLVSTSTACGQLGVKGGCTDDTPYVKAVVNYINAHGGIRGRPVDPVIYTTAALGDNWAAQSEAACSALIEDAHAFVVLSTYVGGRDDFAQCAAEHGTPVLDPGYWPYDAQEYAELYPYLYQPDRVRPERWLTAYISGLWQEGFFTPGSKIGLLRFDDAQFTDVTNDTIIPQLAAHGLHLTDDIAVNTPASTTDLGGMSSELSNAILRLRSDGVDHVIFFELGAEMSYFFFPLAESQGYRPRYGIQSYQLPNLLVQNDPTAQFVGAEGIGWLPGDDVNASDDPGGQPAATCKALTNAAGLNGGTGRSVYCATLFFLKAALDRAPSLTVDGLRIGTESLGQSYQAASNLGTTFGPGRYDGSSLARQLSYVPSCTCFRYGSISINM